MGSVIYDLVVEGGDREERLEVQLVLRWYLGQRLLLLFLRSRLFRGRALSFLGHLP